MSKLKSENLHLWVGSIMIAALMGTALVSPLYPVYRSAWSLSAGEVTQLYVIYMAGALASLLFLGRLADRFGYRKVMGGALTICLAGTVGSIFARNFMQFAAARFCVGIAASLVTTSGTVGLATVTPQAKRGLVALLSSVFISLGFAVGPFIGGIAGQWLPSPLVTAQIPSLVLILLGMLVLVLILPAPPKPARVFSFRDLLPKLSWSPAEHSLQFGLACCQPFITFGVFGLYASMAPMLIRDFTGFDGPIISGAYIGFFLLLTALAQTLARMLPTRATSLCSLLLLALGNLCMFLNLTLGSIALFAFGVTVAAIAHGMSMLASTSVVLKVSTSENRSALTSTYWAIGYSGSIFPLLLLGWLADMHGMTPAVQMFCATVIGASLLVFVLTLFWAGKVPAKSDKS